MLTLVDLEEPHVEAIHILSQITEAYCQTDESDLDIVEIYEDREKMTTETWSLIDTDTLSYLLKRQKPAYQNSLHYLNKLGDFKISCLTYYECLPGYKANSATTKLKLFQSLLPITEIIYLDQAILETAGEIYGCLKQNFQD